MVIKFLACFLIHDLRTSALKSLSHYVLSLHLTKDRFAWIILSYVILSELEVNLSDIPQNDKQVSVISTSSNDLIMPKKGGFKIASLNIASLPKHIDELRIVMSNDEIDVLAVNESRMGSTVPNDMISIYGYS